jgi:hypothetical protein
LNTRRDMSEWSSVGTDAHELVGDPKGINPQWSPDGTRLALQPNLPNVEYPTRIRVAHLHRGRRWHERQESPHFVRHQLDARRLVIRTASAMRAPLS